MVMINGRTIWMSKIINFHAVRDITWFEKVIFLLKNKYSLINIEELESFYYKGKNLKNICHITIDDGDKVFLEVIYPVLKKYNIPATIFVSPEMCLHEKNFWFQEMHDFDNNKVKQIIEKYFKLKPGALEVFPLGLIMKNIRIGEILTIIKSYAELYPTKSTGPQNINARQLKEMDEQGLITIGAHTLTHPVLANENSDRSSNEISGSFNMLQDILGHEIKYFAYPNGIPGLDFNQREMETLKNNNCKLAFTTRANDISVSDNPLLIPRYGISYGNQLFLLAKLLTGSNWENLKDMLGKGEIKIRNRINSVFKNSTVEKI